MAKIIGVPPVVARAHQVSLLSAFGALTPELPTKPPAQEPGVLGTGVIAEVVMKAGCAASGGVWNDTLKKCIEKIGPVIEPTLQDLCTQSGGTWNTEKRTCERGLAPEEKKQISPVTLLAIGTGVLILGWWVASTRKPKRRR